jgi:hypothetical protein
MDDACCAEYLIVCEHYALQLTNWHDILMARASDCHAIVFWEIYAFRHITV